MSTWFWIRRFFTVFAIALAIIAGVQYLKGHDAAYALGHGLMWAAISASLFTATRWYRARRGEHYALCRDTPEMLQEPESRSSQLRHGSHTP